MQHLIHVSSRAAKVDVALYRCSLMDVNGAVPMGN